jgi:hypothetical protein
VARLPPWWERLIAVPRDRLSLLSPEPYLAVRVADQLRYYRRSALKLHRALVAWQGAILGLGGLGTLLAALDHSVWVAVTTAAVPPRTLNSPTTVIFRGLSTAIRSSNEANSIPHRLRPSTVKARIMPQHLSRGLPSVTITIAPA